jgi:hypothetical protein
MIVQRGIDEENLSANSRRVKNRKGTVASSRVVR